MMRRLGAESMRSEENHSTHETESTVSFDNYKHLAIIAAAAAIVIIILLFTAPTLFAGAILGATIAYAWMLHYNYYKCHT